MKQQPVIAKRSWIRLGVLVFIALVINIFSWFPLTVEKVYSVGAYPWLASLFRLLTGWLPFSIGDIGYTLVCIWLLVKLVRGIIAILKRQYGRARFLRFLFKVVCFVLWFYIVFELVWGLNYSRPGIEYQLKISKTEYTKQEITTLADQLIDSLNFYRKQIADTGLPVIPIDSVYAEAYHSYHNAEIVFPFLHYRNRSVKGSLFTGIGDYMGFSGYYNPFTGEAQTRTDIPRILLPYIACHEMAHQLGYASESEANFVGYLSAVSSRSNYFRYSVYLDLFTYAQGEEIFLYGKDKDFKSFEAVIKNNRLRLDTLVKQDRKAIREFFRKRSNRISPAVSNLYDQYLKLNKQSAGVNSYDEVIGWLISYRKKYGKI